MPLCPSPGSQERQTSGGSTSSVGSLSSLALEPTGMVTVPMSESPRARPAGLGGAAPMDVSWEFSSWNRSILTEIHLCHACSDHEIENGNARTGRPGHVGGQRQGGEGVCAAPWAPPAIVIVIIIVVVGGGVGDGLTLAPCLARGARAVLVRRLQRCGHTAGPCVVRGCRALVLLCRSRLGLPRQRRSAQQLDQPLRAAAAGDLRRRHLSGDSRLAATIRRADPRGQRRAGAGSSTWTVVSRAFPSWNRSILTEIHLCHACFHHEIENGNARTGRSAMAPHSMPCR
eukprot:COSAG01_NODE_1748_length_9329_cov_99.035861_11_plen_286_part_00